MKHPVASNLFTRKGIIEAPIRKRCFMVNKIHFAKRISTLRRKIGLSQVELAERLGVTSQAVSKWECGGSHS